jgi:DNA-binding transcriptional ArsR family regulator
MTANHSRTTSVAASASTPAAGRRGDGDGDDGGSVPDASDVAFDELLDLLGDDYACEILRELAGGPMPARALADRCEMSRPTVYRRLDRLTAAGVVASRLRPAADGHHRQVFHLVLDEVEFRVREDGIDGSVRVRD